MKGRMVTIEPSRGVAAGGDPNDPHDSWIAAGLSRVGLVRFVKRAQAAVGLAGEVDVLLANDRTLRRLNREFRGKDKATDVLSFPAAEVAREHAGRFAGDLAISLETAARQAREHGHLLSDEVRVLLLHGLLHLSGMDHETDRGEMAAREAELRRMLRLPSGLIARVEGSLPAGKKSRSAAGMTGRKRKATAGAIMKKRLKR
ncbi:MAG TPA: rRNA maturation RNase YbeY [Acidobacteriaceae bacterium]|nr:rRNA maturation RNase YbeY [Acidobacteriaceae bacterium]